MHGNLQKSSSTVTDQSVTANGQLGNDWFVGIVDGLYPKDAGLAMHLVTGFEERTCYRYAAGDRKVPGFFLFMLLRSDHGEQWLNAIMDGCEQPWWKALKRARRITAAQDAIDRS